MSSSDRGDTARHDHLHRVIAEYLEAVESGATPVRQELLEHHPDFADELAAFFADHDRMKEIAEPEAPAVEPPLPESAVEAPTLPPRKPGPSQSPGDMPTLPPEGTKAASSQNAPPLGARVRYFGDYELLEEIARGGMGVVYKARQMSLNRIVALKMILAGQLASEEDVKRFYTEAEAAAHLDHPGIVPIHEVGQHEGQHYFSMGFVDGGSLSAKLAGGPLPPRKAAEYTKKVAAAIAFAHERGVIHRDLKPANVLLDNSDEPKVTDFGLAKKVEGESGLTATGQILGTPSFMPPEQASGRIGEITETADVYALGAILYNLITGRPPFQADNPLDTLLQVLEQEPVSPRQLNPKVPRDLETICLRCLEKEPHRRHASAQDLADELQRFLNGEPIRSRPISTSARAWRWCRRNPVVASLALAVAVALVGGACISSYFAVRARAQARRADEKATEAQQQRQRAESRELDARRSLYLAHMHLAEQSWQRGDVGRVVELLKAQRPGAGRHDLRGFEWFHLWRITHMERITLRGHAFAVKTLAFSPDGKTLATGAWDGKVILWDVGAGRALCTFGSHPFNVERLALSPDGKTLAVACWDSLQPGSTGELKFWDTTTRQERHALKTKPKAVRAVAFSPDGKTLATASEEGLLGQIALWDMATGLEQSPLQPSQGNFSTVVFSDDGETLAAAGADGSIRLWDVASRRIRHTLSGHADPVHCLAFAPDGKTVASAGGGHVDKPVAVKLWNTADGKERAVLEGHVGPVWSVGFSPDGRTLATGGNDMTVRLWDAATGRQENTLKGHKAGVWALAFAPRTDALLATASFAEVKLWDLPTNQGPDTIKDAHAQGVTFLGFSSDREALFSGGNGRSSGEVKRWRLATTKQLPGEFSHSGGLSCAAVSRDGAAIASAGLLDRDLKLWNTAQWTLQREMPKQTTPVAAAAFAPHGRMLAAGYFDNTVKLWDIPTGSEKLTLRGHIGPVYCVAFSPDGTWMASGANDEQSGALTIYDAASGRMRREGRVPFLVTCLAFDPNGDALAVGSHDYLDSAVRI